MNKAPSSLFINLTFYFMVMMQLARSRMRLSAVCRSASCLEFSTGAKYGATACISHAASRRGDHEGLTWQGASLGVIGDDGVNLRLHQI